MPGATERLHDLAKSLRLDDTAVDLGATLRPGDLERTQVARIDRARGLIPKGSLPQLSVKLPGRADEPPRPDGDIVVEGLLGEGGMGRVYLAEQRSLGRKVALKTVQDATDPVQVGALVAEGAIAGSLDHPNVLPVHLLGFDTEERPVLVMKRIEGASWSDLIADPSHELWTRAVFLDADRLVAHVTILMQVCEAVHYAHSRGVIHRDIKPDNVMVGASSEVYVVDWGIAAPPGEDRASAGLVGTPQYVAPEMVTGASLGPETDVYLLGATLHYVLTGKPRHDGKTMMEVLSQALLSAPVTYPEDVPEELAALANEATRVDPAQRIRTAADFRARLAAYVAQRGSRALLTAARERVAELEALRAAGKIDDPRLAQLAAEARFGLEQAVRAAPGDRRAQAARAELSRSLVELEIDRKNPKAARAMLGELAAPDAALEAKVSRLEADLALAEADHVRLADIATNMDPRPLRRLGAWIALLIAMVDGLIHLALHLGALGELDGGRLVLVGGFMFVVFFLAAAVLVRRGLVKTTIARNIMGGLLGAITMFFVHRVGAWLAGDDPLATLRSDMSLFAVSSICLGFLGERRWVFGGLVVAAGAVVSGFWPAHTVSIFGASTALGLGAIAARLLTTDDD